MENKTQKVLALALIEVYYRGKLKISLKNELAQFGLVLPIKGTNSHNVLFTKQPLWPLSYVGKIKN